MPGTYARIPWSRGGVPWLPTWLLSRVPTSYSISRRPMWTSISTRATNHCAAPLRVTAARATPPRSPPSASIGAAPTCSSSARQANENPPKLKTLDAKGYRRDFIEFHPAYHDLMAASVAAGLQASTWRDDATPASAPAQVTRARALLHGGAGGDRTSLPHHHDACRGRGAGGRAVARRQADAEDRVAALRRSFPSVVGEDRHHARHGHDREAGRHRRARQHARARSPIGEGYAVTGHKWFMSAPMCDAFLVLAQAPGGLTCFLMPRFRPDGSVNGLHFQRLKDKLGNRSNASSEVEFADAFAWRVGEEGRGVRTIINMVQLTRLDCAIASAGIMRMALAQALHHARHRSVFQKRLSRSADDAGGAGGHGAGCGSCDRAGDAACALVRSRGRRCRARPHARGCSRRR